MPTTSPTRLRMPQKTVGISSGDSVRAVVFQMWHRLRHHNIRSIWIKANICLTFYVRVLFPLVLEGHINISL